MRQNIARSLRSGIVSLANRAAPMHQHLKRVLARVDATVLHGNAARERLEGLAAGTSGGFVHDLGEASPTPHRPQHSGRSVDAAQVRGAAWDRIASDRRPPGQSAALPGSEKLRQLYREVSVQARHSILRPAELRSGADADLFLSGTSSFVT